MNGQAHEFTGNLPAALTSFVGRRREIAQVRRQVSTSRLVTLTGVGGVGKTRLALEVAAHAHRGFPDGAWLVDLAPITDGSLVAQAVANELGIREHSTRATIEQVIQRLGDRRLLLVLDNCEHLLEACTAVLDVLLRSCPELRVLATSRESLRMGGESVYLVPPLTVPVGDQPVPVEALSQYEAVNLLVDRAGAVQPGFAITEDNRDAVMRLCAELDGLPLAIELAATRLRSLSVEQVVELLVDRFRLLSAGSRTALPRQRTLRALIDWSYDLCSEVEKRLWARLSVFAGGFDLNAAEEVCADEHIPREEVVDVLDSLIARSIVVRGTPGRQAGFAMLETVRRYGHDRLVERGELDELRQRHGDFFLRLTRRGSANWCGPEQESALARLRADQGNLQAALDWWVTHPAGVQEALGLCGGLCYHWCADGFLTEGRRWLDRALALPAVPTPARCEALWVAGWVALLQGDAAAAQARLVECRDLADRIGDPVGRAHVAGVTGSALLFSGQMHQAIDFLKEAVVALREVGDAGGALLAQSQLALALTQISDLEAAAATAREGILASEACGEHWARSYLLWVLGRVTWMSGDPDEANRLTVAALELQRGFRDSVGAVMMIEQLAWIAAGKREFTQAAGLLGTADSIWRNIATDVSAFGPAVTGAHAECGTRTLEALPEQAFRAAFADGMQPTVRQAIDLAVHHHTPAPKDGQPQRLTRREREVAELVSEGLSNRQIAERLVVSTRTVDGHVEHLLAKLGFRSRTQIVAWVATNQPG